MVTTQGPPTQLPDSPCPHSPDFLLYGDNCYKFISEAENEGQSWERSRALCHDLDSHLASIHTYEENYWILSKVILAF